VFRGGTDVVAVDVSIRRGNLPVRDLAARDFALTDNGVRQQVEVVSTDTLPLNLSLLVDTSGSVNRIADVLATQVTEASRLLRPDDQFRLIAFASSVIEILPMQPASRPVKIDHVATGGGTSLYDALASALIRKRAPERGEIVVSFTDGLDTTSALSVARLRDIARRSEAVLYLYILRTPAFVSTCMPLQRQSGTVGQREMSDPERRPTAGNVLLNEREIPIECDQSGLGDIAGSTGGRAITLAGNSRVPDGLKKALDEFHTSYLLRYAPKGVAAAGWHDLSVKVNRPGKYDIHARRGYFGG
jgi:VWFA-related protein